MIRSVKHVNSTSNFEKNTHVSDIHSAINSDYAAIFSQNCECVHIKWRSGGSSHT